MKFPVAYRVYKGKSTPTPTTLAREMLRTIPDFIRSPFRIRVLADSGFEAAVFLDEVRQLGFEFVVGVRTTRRTERRYRSARQLDHAQPAGLWPWRGAHQPHTIRSYTTGVRAYLAYALTLGWKRLTEHDTDLTIGYIRGLEGQGMKPGTINSRRSAARALYRTLRWANVLEGDPFADTPRAHDTEDKWTKLEAYSREDINALLALADADETRFLLLGAHGALRMSELIGLRWQHIDLLKRVMVVTGKARKTATAHLTAALTESLSQVPEEEREGPVLAW
ncbi:hypothetical protein DEMA109039_22345 [Deinococcus marmoris]